MTEQQRAIIDELAEPAPHVRFPVRHQYDDDRDAYERELTDIVCNDESLTQQHFAKDADLNVIVKRYGITDGAALPAVYDPSIDSSYFGDFTNTTDLRDALDQMRIAGERFMALPAEIRTRFGNDPATFIDWINDPSNLDDAVDLKLLGENVRIGLREKKEPPKTPEAPKAAEPPKTQS